LDKPFLHQYFHWLKRVVVLDLGISLVKEKPVWKLICTCFARTFELALAAIVIALLIAVPIGILGGVKQGSWMDSMGVTIAVTGVSMPNYWLGLVLIILFSVKLKLLPVFGYGDWRHMVMPAITLGTALTAYTTRILRSAIIETLQSEYLIALRARGISKRFVLGKHILKNALLPVVTVVGLEFGMILEGAVITETVFAWPGIRDLMVSAVSNRDYSLIQGLVLFTTMVFVLINFLMDIFFSFPEIVAAMAVAGLAGPGTLNLLFALSFVSWTRYARLVRGIISVRERDYIKAAQLSGVSRTVIIIRHILPANLSSIIVLATIGLAKAILAVSALGFLGFGIQPPYPEWGTLLMEGKDYILSAPHLSLYPGIAIMLSVLFFNLLGDALRDIWSRQC
jgi:peptide/nickel transport system permease protein